MEYKEGMDYNKDEIKNILELSKDSTEKNLKWMQTIVVMASGLLALLVSLHKTTSKTEEIHDVYVTTLILIGLGILSGSIYLYVESHVSEKLRKKYLQHLKYKYTVGTQNNLVVVSPYKIFYVAKYISVLSFLLVVPLLIYYAILIDSLP